MDINRWQRLIPNAFRGSARGPRFDLGDQVGATPPADAVLKSRQPLLGETSRADPVAFAVREFRLVVDRTRGDLVVFMVVGESLER
ncbi:MAG: hypothetical protein QGG09_06220, partial [Pirellulaceae bacterium]|nr:hypothetical protein [Pirellulaceae bacterium]